MPSVSVIVAAYNGSAFIRAALDSVLAQTRAADQVIAVDDGSIDETPAILAAYRPRITVVRKPNGGPSSSRNCGAELARGELIASLDEDDVWEPTYLERTVSRLASLGASVAGVIAGWQRIDVAGRPLPGTRTILRGRLERADFLVENRCPTGAVLLRREALDAVGGFDTALRITQDWDLWLRLTASGRSLIAIEECLWRFRQRPGSLSSDPVRMRDEAILTLAKAHADAALPALHARGVAYAHLHASTQLYAGGRTAEADADFAAAVRAWPALLDEDETYYATLCAEEPAGAKLTATGPDLERAGPRLIAALAACGGLAPHMQRAARGRACRAMAQIAYRQRRMAAVRRYARQALAHDARLLADPATLGPAVKSLAGARLIDGLGRWRRAAARPTED